MACVLAKKSKFFHWKGPEHGKGIGSQTSPTLGLSELKFVAMVTIVFCVV